MRGVPRNGDTKIRRFPQMSLRNLVHRWRNPLTTSDNGVAAKQPRADLKGVGVLVVEDHWHVANALKSFLEAEGMHINTQVPTQNAD